MSWSAAGSKAAASLARHAAPASARVSNALQRPSPPRHLLYHPRRSAQLNPVHALNFSASTSSGAPTSSKAKASSRARDAADAEAAPTPGVRVTDKRSNQPSTQDNTESSSRTPQPETVLEVDDVKLAAKPADASAPNMASSTRASSATEQSASDSQQQEAASSLQAQAASASTTNATGPPTHEDLLKQRFYHAQEQNKRVYSGLTPPPNPTANLYPSFTTPQMDEAAPAPSATATTSTSGSTSSDSSAASSSASAFDTAGAPQASQQGVEHAGDVEFDNRFHRHASSQSLQSLQMPFDTHGFVKRLEAGGWLSTALKAQRLPPNPKSAKSKQTQPDADAGGLQLQIARRHDPAEAIMQGVRHLITTRGRQLANACLNKSDVENQAYLFKAALSEIRTEVQVRGRNDAAGLRSITTLLQREVDALEQKMKEDVERLKHDIQVDMNNRKAESKEEQNNLEQEIQDLNNRFTISLSDLKTEIEQNVKWDATRRSLFLVFGIAAIVAANLAIADYLTRDDEAAKAAASKELITAGHPPASTNAGAPASLGWATEGRILYALPVMLLKPSSRSAAAGRRAMHQLRRHFSTAIPAVATAGLFTSTKLGRKTGAQPLASASHLPGQRWFSSTASAAKEQAKELRVPDSDVVIKLQSDSISIESKQLGLQPFQFDHIWLRDACQAPQSVHPSNRQKLFHTSDVPLGVPLLDASHPPTLSSAADEPVLRLTFAKEHAVVNAFTAAFGEVKKADAPHVSEVPISFLLRHAIDTFYADTHMDIMSVPESWAAKDLTHFRSVPWAQGASLSPSALEEGSVARPARIPWDAIRPEDTSVQRTEALYALTEAVLRDGFAFVTRLPTDKTATEEGESSARLRDLALTMGELRNTFYGLLWDVQSKADARNIAYTNLDLGLHMDLLYFQNPPRFQFLHMLRNKVRGGASIFVDSFKVAERMWDEERELWEVLTKVPVGFHYVNDGRHYRYTHPTFELAHDTEGHAGPPLQGTTMPRLSAVNYSPPFQSPLPLHPTEHLKTAEQRQTFYRALKRFSDLTLAEEFRYEKQMEEGECVIFDNRRVLHSRKGFEWDESKQGEVKRWLKGCYVDGDAIWSTYRTLRTKLHGRAPLVPGTRRSMHSAAAPAKPWLSAARSFSTSSAASVAAHAAAGTGSTDAATEEVDVSSFAPLSDDPTVVDLRSLGGLRSREPSTSFASYRPVPPVSTRTLPKLYKQLSKSRLTFLVVLTGMAGYALCPASLTVAVASPVATLLALTAGMTLCSAAANALNQLVEAPYDAQMPRTRGRPLPSRAVTPLHAFSFAAASASSGVGLLALAVNPLTAALGAANVVLYSFTYTPMKRMSIANTWVGAVVGALPPLMGWAACTGTLHHAADLGGWSLAALLFAWQFPHFNSLAHTLRAEYARGGYRMMAVTDPALNRRVSLRYAVALLPICTVMMPLSGIVAPVAFAVLSTPLNLLMAHAAWKFYTDGTVKAARWCFWVSLIHLPAVMLLAMGCKPEVRDGLYRFLGWSTDEPKEEEKLV
ncbi:gamma-butyrobetaine hydroxylase [Moesziomyces antarcticus]|uniref:Protoheme IX farnesyltransferase, mitochondrial n=2 Tax=Pseudozyma antarctica TaxID=84753 RepID=A0A081CJL9_PSEA2|nr:gamma-butyrobetaine hydroxylase [Moesziomyces antarcticus]GAK66865.1 gamma-butyrobetaine hydroxylase [Moesziomyces antarcticus]SPO47915.1 related to COX10 - farnesyl transferase [Moesziomyces antarcticus]